MGSGPGAHDLGPGAARRANRQGQGFPLLFRHNGGLWVFVDGHLSILGGYRDIWQWLVPGKRCGGFGPRLPQTVPCFKRQRKRTRPRLLLRSPPKPIVVNAHGSKLTKTMRCYLCLSAQGQNLIFVNNAARKMQKRPEDLCANRENVQLQRRVQYVASTPLNPPLFTNHWFDIGILNNAGARTPNSDLQAVLCCINFVAGSFQ